MNRRHETAKWAGRTIATVLGAALAVAGWSATINVPGDFANVQAAVNQANINGGSNTIVVAAGVYPASYQVVVNNNLTIVGAGPSATTIVPTASTGGSGDARGWFLVNAGRKIIVRNIGFDGAGFNIEQAIRSYGQGYYHNCSFMNMTYPGYLGRGIVTVDASATINACTFRNIGRIHTYFFGPASAGSLVTGCTFLGKGDVDRLDYGVEVEGGGNVMVAHNMFRDCRGVAYSDGSSSAGILATTFFASGTSVTAEYNTFVGCTFGLAIGFLTTDTTSAFAHNNNFVGDGYYDWPGNATGVLGKAIDNTGLTTVSATNNWYGSSAGPTGGDGVNGLVTSAPFLTAAVPELGTPVDLDGTYMMPLKNAAVAATFGGPQVTESSDGSGSVKGTYTPFNETFGKAPKGMLVSLLGRSWSCITDLSGNLITGAGFKVGSQVPGDTTINGAYVVFDKPASSFRMTLKSTDGTLTAGPVTDTTGATRFMVDVDVSGSGGATATVKTLNGSWPGKAYPLGGIATTITSAAGFYVKADGNALPGTSTAVMRVSDFLTNGGPANVMYLFSDNPYAKSTGELDYRFGMSNVDRPMAGFQAALNNLGSAVQGGLDSRSYTNAPFVAHFQPFGLLIDGGISFGNLYSGIQTPATLANLGFAFPPVEGVANVGIDPVNGVLVTRFSDEFGGAVAPSLFASNYTVVDNTVPVLSGLAATEGANNVLNGATLTIQGTVHITVDARDLASGLSDFPTVTIPELGVSGQAMYADAGNLFSCDIVVGTSAPCGVANITINARDEAGNTSSTAGTLNINKSQVNVTVALGGVSASPNRWIRFVVGGSGGVNSAITIDKVVSFTTGSANVVLTGLDGLPDCTKTLTQLWIKDPVHTLAKNVAIVKDGNAQYNVGTVTLQGGDANNDNIIDILDFGVFAFQWGSSQPVNSAISDPANSNFSCSGTVGIGDYTFISTGFLTAGDPLPGPFNSPKGGPKSKCTVAEMVAAGVPTSSAMSMDANKDGWITAPEVAAWLQLRMKIGGGR